MVGSKHCGKKWNTSKINRKKREKTKMCILNGIGAAGVSLKYEWQKVHNEK